MRPQIFANYSHKNAELANKLTKGLLISRLVLAGINKLSIGKIGVVAQDKSIVINRIASGGNIGGNFTIRNQNQGNRKSK